MTESSGRRRLREVAGRLSKLSREQAYDVYTLFDWPADLPTDRYWMAPELMTCHGTPIWGELSPDQRLRLSRWESVNFFSLNVHLIRELIGEVADRIYTSRFPGLAEFFHDFISEENEHMWFFATFCQRYGGRLYPPAKAVPGGRASLDVLNDVMIFGRILIAEELCDAFNAAMATDHRLPDLVRQINLVHHRDESRHIAFGRQMMRALTEEARDQAGPAALAEVGTYLARYITVCLRSLYNARAYADAGLSNGTELRTRLIADPARRREHQRLMRRPIGFLERIGLCGPGDVQW